MIDRRNCSTIFYILLLCLYMMYVMVQYIFQTVDKLSKLYDRVVDIDLVVGMMAETPLPGSLLGTTATCLIS